LYGYGEVAEDFIKQLKVLSGKQVVAWSDKEEHEATEIKKIEDIPEQEYDTVLIAMSTEEEMQEAARALLEKGIPKEKIVWRKPVRLELDNMHFFEKEDM
jgi:hypothetical protein